MGHAAYASEMAVKQDPKVVAEVRQFVRLVAGEYGMDDFVPCLVDRRSVRPLLGHPRPC